MSEEFLQLAPVVLKEDATCIDMRIQLIQKLMANPDNFYLAQTEVHRLDAQLTLKFMGHPQNEATEAENERLRSQVSQLKLRMQANRPTKTADDSVQFRISGSN